MPSSTLAFSNASPLSLRRPRSPCSHCQFRFHLHPVTHVRLTRTAQLRRRLYSRPPVSEHATELEYHTYTSDSPSYTAPNATPATDRTDRNKTFTAVDKVPVVKRSASPTPSSPSRSFAPVQTFSPTSSSETNARAYHDFSKRSPTTMVESATGKQALREVEETASSTSNDDPPPPPAPLWPRALLLFVAAVFGTNFPMVKFLQSGAVPLDASTAALARFSLASLALMPAAVMEVMRSKVPPFGVVTAGAIVGLPVSLGYYSQALSLQNTDAGKSAFLCSLAVVIVPLLSNIFPSLQTDDDAKSKSLLATWGAPILAVAGVALLELADVSPPNVGDAWGLVQAVAFAMGFMLNERAARKYPGYSLTISALQLSVMGVAAFFWVAYDMSMNAGALTLPSVADAFCTLPNGLGLLYTGLVSTALTVVLSNISLSRVTAGELTVLLSTEPMWAAVFSAVLLGEHFGSGTFVGAALILAACTVNQADNLPLNFLTDNPLWRTLSGPVSRLSGSVSWIQSLLKRISTPSS